MEIQKNAILSADRQKRKQKKREVERKKKQVDESEDTKKYGVE